MRRLNGIVLSIATLLAAGPAMAAPPPSLLDQFDARSAASVFLEHPEVMRFTTVGSPDGRTFASARDEAEAALARAQAMMTDFGAGWADVVEVRIETTSESDRIAVATLLGEDPRLSRLAVTYRVVDRLSAPRARVGLDLVARPVGATRALG